MQPVSQTRKKVSIAMKLIVILSAATGIVMSAAAGRNTFMGGSRVFMYFTIQSNIAAALMSIAGGWFLLRKKAAGRIWHIVKLAITVSVTLTGVVFAVLLVPILGGGAWSVPNTLTHLVVPLAAVADFFLVMPGTEMKKRNVIYVIIPPLMYAIYAGIGYVKGWEFAQGQIYPYFFLNWGSSAGAIGFTDELPYMGCVWWILALALFLIIVGLCYIAIAEKIGQRGRKEP